MKQYIEKNKSNLLFTFLFFFFYYYPIISLNLKYRDDYIRSLYLGLAWTQEGRFISKLILNIFTFTDGVLTSPLTQILSILCIAITIIYVAKILFKAVNFYSYSIVSLIFLNPFYLQNMSFGYDCLPMTISTCCAVLAAIIFIQSRYYILITALCAVIILFSYQTTVSVFISCTLFVLFKHFMENGWNNIDGFYTKAFINFTVFIVAILSFVMSYPLLFNDVHAHSVMSSNNIKINLSHTILYLKLLFFNMHALVYIGAAVTFLSFLIVQYKQHQTRKICILLNIIILSLIYIVLLIVTEGPSILLKFEINNLRVLISVSFLWLISLYIISLFSRRLYYIFYYGFVIFCFSYSYSYGIFLRDQDNYYKLMMTNINYDISHHHYTKKPSIVTLNAFPIAESNKRLNTKVPLFTYLYGEQDFRWMSAMKLSNALSYYPTPSLEEICNSIRTINGPNNSTIETISADDYKLYLLDKVVVIDFLTKQENELSCEQKNN